MKVESINSNYISKNSDFEKPPVNIEVNNETLKAQDIDKISKQELNLMPVSERAVIEAIEKANKISIDHNTKAEFSVHEVTKDIMIKIVDTERNEVIREFPPKKILDMVAKLWDLAGIIVDERR